MGDFGYAEAEVPCPVPLETLQALKVSSAAEILATVRDFSEEKRVRLALYCYNRAHLRTIGLSVASTVEPGRLAELAGTMGEVLAAQCRANGLSFGIEAVPVAKPSRSKPKISLGGRG